jgi:hypothetical protein
MGYFFASHKSVPFRRSNPALAPSSTPIAAPSVAPTGAPVIAPSLAPSDLNNLLEQSFREVLLTCQDACAARQSAVEGSAEWYKCTGEILACGKLTKVLSKLHEDLLELVYH